MRLCLYIQEEGDGTTCAVATNRKIGCWFIKKYRLQLQNNLANSDQVNCASNHPPNT